MSVRFNKLKHNNLWNWLIPEVSVTTTHWRLPTSRKWKSDRNSLNWKLPPVKRRESFSNLIPGYGLWPGRQVIVTLPAATVFNFSEKASSLLFQWWRENKGLIVTCCSSLFWQSHGQFFYSIFYFAIAKLQQTEHTTKILCNCSKLLLYFLLNELKCETEIQKYFRYRCDFSDVLQHLLDYLLSTCTRNAQGSEKRE